MKYYYSIKHNIQQQFTRITNSVKHYENFPVASILLPKNLYFPIQNIYNFARSADDIADEGEALPFERLKLLSQYTYYLDKINNKNLNHDCPKLFKNLDEIIVKYQLSIQYFYRLIQAFKQDVIKNSYNNKQQVLLYCQYSANPIGRLLLQIYKKYNTQNIKYSDNICTALQLINFYQDVAIDYKKNRVYISQDLLYQYGLSVENIKNFTIKKINYKSSEWIKWQDLISTQVLIAQKMLLSGLPLYKNLSKRTGLEIKTMIYAANLICDKIHKVKYDVFNKRPIIKWYDWFTIILHVIFK